MFFCVSTTSEVRALARSCEISKITRLRGGVHSACAVCLNPVLNGQQSVAYRVHFMRRVLEITNRRGTAVVVR